MYVWDVDAGRCCQYILAASKGIAQKSFNGLPNGSVDSFLQLAESFSAHFIASKREAVLIPDLQDGVAYMTFLNVLLPGRFKFSFTESKVTPLADALRKVQDFYPSHEDMHRG